MKFKLTVLCYTVGCLLFCVCLSFAIYHLISPNQDNPIPETQVPGESLLLDLEATTEATLAAEPSAAATENTQTAETAEAVNPSETTEAAEATETTTAPKETTGRTITVVYCIGDQVNVRSGPGTDHESIGKLKWAQTVDRVSRENENWSKVIFEGREAFVASRYLSETEPEAKETTAPTEAKKPQADSAKPTEQPPKIEMKFENADETVYCTGSNVNVRKGPGTDYGKLGKLQTGDSLRRTGIGKNWSRVEYQGSTAYVSSTYLSKEKPSAGRSRPSAYQGPAFTYQYMEPQGIMPFALFLPGDYDGQQSLPLILSLHGHSETGRSREYFENKFLVRDFRNWENTGLAPFDAIIVCPHLSGAGYSDCWNNPDAASMFFTMLDYVINNYHVDRSRISLQGQSMGAQGALYMAADTRACFSKLVLVSGYEPWRDYSGVRIPVRGYSGSPDIPRPREDRTSYNFMAQCFTAQFGSDNWYRRACSHDDIPLVAFHEDKNGDGRSDLIDWLLS